MARQTVKLADSKGWRSPVMFLMLMAVANAIAFSTWRTLLNNFAVERAHFTGREIGILQSLREVPGLLAFTAIAWLLIVREQHFALLSILVMASAAAVTGFFPHEYAFYAITLLMSFGFHYYETMNQSLALQWLPKADAPRLLGKILSVTAMASIGTFIFLFIVWKTLKLDFTTVYLMSGGVSIAIVIYLWLAFPRFEAEVTQHKHLFLRSRYWLYYLLTMLAGARRQIFIVFAAFLMVEKFHYSVAGIAALFFINGVFNIWITPKIGGLIGRFGERNALVLEYTGLIIVFLGYALVNDPWIAAGLYIADHALFSWAIALKTYFQKIADPKDIAPTAGVAFSINHIAAVVIPVVFGMIWLKSPALVFELGAGVAALSLLLALLIPRHPQPGRETLLAARAAARAAE